MVKWIKLFDNQYVGFWVLGLLLFFLQEIPYMVMPLFKLETNPINLSFILPTLSQGRLPMYIQFYCTIYKTLVLFIYELLLS